MSTDLFRGVAPFVAVGEEQSFRRAGQRLGISTAAVSKAVAGLERELGVTLLIRGARSTTLSREGLRLFESCRAAVTGVAEARRAVQHLRSEPSGELSISAPFLAVELLGPALTLLRARHPRLTFRVLVTDRLSKLAEEDVDIAVRVGPLSGSNLVKRTLRETTLVTVASPGYLSREGSPLHPEALAGHACLAVLGPRGKVFPFAFADGDRVVPHALVTDHAPTALDAARAGMGITQALDFMVVGDLASGALVQLFADRVAAGPPIHAVCSAGQRATAKVKAAFAALGEVVAARRA